MNKKLALIPVDARPVTRELPRQLAAIGGWEVLVPEKEQLGFLKAAGKVDVLQLWLESVATEVDGFVLSTDMIGYGGLVPSRINTESESVILERFQVLRKLKAQYPEKKMMVFSATMRISNNYVNEEEKEYWSEYGEEIWAYSYYSHRFEKTGCEDSRVLVEELIAKIPVAILEDYQATRQKNFNLNMSLFELVEEGVLDILVFPQDDTSEYGMNIREQEKLAAEVAERSLFSKVFIYPGADEVAGVLIARMIYALEGVKVPLFYPMFSGEKGALSSAMYEDRPIVESVKGQIFAFGSYTVDSSAEADIVLAVNVPGKRQGDLALQKFLGEVDTPDRNIGEWILRVKHHLAKGKAVAIADVAYANGADPALVRRLIGEIAVADLSGFAAWNTAGNTLGTVVAQAAMVHLQRVKGEDCSARLVEQLALRFLDDYVYQAVVRQEVRRQVDDADPRLLEVVATSFEKHAGEFLERVEVGVTVTDIYLPWNRTFEIGLELGKKQ
ncbi:DUF4127 family protein [Anaerobacillus alkaliphilus]|uniref:DUF4127 family protein n=1 Tax=Anaerobacillus alkaliphilus TaxID=1548597 RepID=A0A4Q0VUE9_9BACI|nr:DUF4127 family protein [Anaerobacillus alkaliphilus]RXJ02178.1 DUF4127 family protein [Anaerobacillus alkaliphilus]